MHVYTRTDFPHSTIPFRLKVRLLTIPFRSNVRVVTMAFRSKECKGKNVRQLIAEVGAMWAKQ